MIKRKGTVLLLALGYSLLPISEINKPQEVHLHDANLHVHANKKEKKTYEENVTSYEAKDGTHNIYWAQGIEPPKMTNDPNLLGKPGYFYNEVYQNKSTYMAEFEPNKGYYDLNKNLEKRPDEHPLCYLGSSGNLILWWLDQNKAYVDEYVRRIKETDIYDQIPGLHSINPIDKPNMWDDMRSAPGYEELDLGGKFQTIYKTPLTKEYLKPYYHKKGDGYFTDMVMDFFFNGYDAIPTLENVVPNTPDNFVKDPRGGFFYPIFGKQQLSKKLVGKKYLSYEWNRDNLRGIFASGRGINFNYLVNHLQGHALTVWGAEYDPNGELTRVYITETDDTQKAQLSDQYLRGLVGFDVHTDSEGSLYLGNDIVVNPSNPGVILYTSTIIDLAQDLFEERLADTAAPEAPTIISQPNDRVMANGGQTRFVVDAEVSDGGDLYYQWYEADNESDEGKLIPGAKNNYLDFKTTNIGTKYLYCVVQNAKNGKIAETKIKPFKIDTQNIPLVNATVPTISFNYDTVKYNQYDEPYALKVKATVDKGTLSYQWYEANDSTAANGRLIKGATSPTYYPSTNNPGNRFYYCVVTNTDYSVSGNPVVTATTRFAKRIIVNAVEIKDAKEPSITKEPIAIQAKQGDVVEPLKVEARSLDGGTLSYQWYEVAYDFSSVTKLVNETSPELIIDTSKPMNKLFKCEVTNTNTKVPGNTKASRFTIVVAVDIEGTNTPSSDSSLVTLEVTNGKLSPDFSSEITSYTANIPHDAEKLLVGATAHENADVLVINPKIGVGETKEVTIKVTAEDGSSTTYTILVTRDGNHKFGDWEIVNEPTCTKEGLERRTCSECGEVEERTIPKTEHKIATRKEEIIEATCTTPGSYKEVTYCTVCGEVLKTEEKTIDALGHKFGEWEVVKEATTEEEGLERRVCSICGEVEERTIPKLDKPIIPEKPDDNNDQDTPSNPEEKPNSNSNLPVIIAGVTIPLGILLTIGIIIFFIKIKH